jgi:hypothetical protein
MLTEINLVNKYAADKNLHEMCRIFKVEHQLTNTHPKHPFRAGDLIEFRKGHYRKKFHINYIAEVNGFDKDGNVYIKWDCYWFPVNDTPINKRIMQ